MKKLIIALILTVIPLAIRSQQVDLSNTKETFSKKNLLKINGGLSANTVLYTGNEVYARDPFTWYLSGTLNINLLNMISMPFTFNLTNSGSNYTYPTMPNRLSIHPKYKWVTGHFGDVAMNFSPYTLNGHLFTGAGVDLEPASLPIKISAMYGRLQRAVELGEGNKNAPAAYKRMGYGTHIRFEKSKYQLGMSLLGAKDDENSLIIKPDSLMIFPQQNVALSFNVGAQLIENLRLTAEYGISMLNRNLQAANSDLAQTSYHAIRTQLDYTFMKNTIGIGYERIDPGYKTLGAYYFNNDLENITLNYARPFLGDKGSLALSGGIEHDDLENEKESQTRRFILSANVSYAHSDNLNFNASYSSFQTYMNIKSQFDYINELTPYDNLDTLNYTQLSQNINLGANYTLSRTETKVQNLNMNLSFQEAADKQGDIVAEGGSSLFYNASLGYGLQFIPRSVNVNLNLNFTSNRMSAQNTFIIGPTLGVNALFLDKKLNSGFGVSYNTNYLEGKNQGEVWNIRLNAGYTLMKKHGFNLSSIYRNNQVKNLNNPLKTNGLTVTAAYNYRF